MPTVNIPPLRLPESESPVPTLCSIHGGDDRSGFGSNQFAGNCNGNLLRELLLYFGASRLIDVMEGSGTSRDVAASLGIHYEGRDLSTGFDATHVENFRGLGQFDFAWIHPPYHDLITYNDDPRCLSRSSDVREFYSRLGAVLENLKTVVVPGGRIAVLIGDICRRGSYFGLPFGTYNVAVDLGLELAAPEIIRLQHGASSSSKAYSFKLIPRIHDVCFVFRKHSTDETIRSPQKSLRSLLGS